MNWAKVDVDLFLNPKIIDAGRDGRDVYLYLLLTNRKHGFHGVIPLRYCEPGYVARIVGIEPKQVEDGLTRANEANLIHTNDESVSIVGWDSSWNGGPVPVRERVRNHRERRKFREIVDDVTACNEVTLPKVTCNGCNAGDKKRSDKKRSGISPHDVRLATEELIGEFNRRLERRITPQGWERPVRAALRKGYTLLELKAVVWWAEHEWRDDERMRSRVTPTTLFKLTSTHGYRTLPEYLALANELWVKSKPDEPIPWRRSEA